MFDFILVLGCGILGLFAHAARTRSWIEWGLRSLIACVCVFEGFSITAQTSQLGNGYGTEILTGMCTATCVMLFVPVRKVLSAVLTALDGVVSLRALSGPIRHKMSIAQAIMSIKVFQPYSIPHMVGLFLYISTFAYFLMNTEMSGFQLPSIPLPVPVTIEQLVSYNGLGLIILSFCGVGIFVSRRPKEAAQRLGWVKPTLAQVGIGLGLVVFSFIYDLLWSYFTHNSGGDLASKLSAYNSGTFSAGGGFEAAVILALATAICAGIGEETLIRGALQPVFGILPAAFLHGILHAQFSHAPVFIVQVAIWSCCMGLVRRFTNTTTTIIGHAGFNFVTTFLFAFNP